MRTEDLLGLIKMSLWGNGTAAADWEIYEEMKRQAIALLPAARFSSLECSPELKQEWKRYALHQLSRNEYYGHQQASLPLTVPYTILKGTSAAMYYPCPEYRTMGDIDIMTRREDFDAARQTLLDSGYHIETDGYEYRHSKLKKNEVLIELHRQFSAMNDPVQSKYLDDLIINSITSTHVLPDPVNGLVLLAHITEHLEDGLGLRQIIDWMMFVDKCLPDENWPAFLPLAENTGLVNLAIVCTRLCEIYLGLPRHRFCADADGALCGLLMEYVLSSGNFGRKKSRDAVFYKHLFTYAPSLTRFFRVLQKRGLKNWKAAEKHKLLRPFAWAYQAFHYVSKGIRMTDTVTKFSDGYAEARKKKTLFDALGVTTTAKGLVILQDGKYVRK